MLARMSALFFAYFCTCVVSSGFAYEVPEFVGTDGDDILYERLSESSEDGEKYLNLPFMEHVPDGLSNSLVSPACDPKKFENDVLDIQLTTKQYFERLRQYFKYCENELHRDSLPGRLGLYQFSKVIYPFLSHPQISRFLVKLPNGLRVPGILALKRDETPRPLVIIKCGVFCSAAQTASLKNYMMKVFDQSPFNVLMLANQTGMDYIYYNKKITIGGWTEGREVLEVGRWMKESWDKRKRISSIHLMGISLGGNAAMFGALYNDELSSDEKIYSSVTAICPVLSLGPTLEKLYQSLLVGRVFQKTTKEHFLQARQYVTDVPDLISDGHFPAKRTDYPNYIGGLAAESLSRQGVPVETSQFFAKNNFWNFSHSAKTPLLVWASKDDSVVNNRLNARVLEEDDFYQKISNVGVLNLSYGDHCGFSTAYGLEASAAVLRTFVLQNSPEFKTRYSVKKVQSWKKGFPKLGPQSEHVEQVWRFYTKNDKAKIAFKIFDWNKDADCREQGPWLSNGRCIQTKEYWIPIADLKDMGGRVPRTEAEAQAITREFNAKIRFQVGDNPLKGTRSQRFDMVWRGHFD